VTLPKHYTCIGCGFTSKEVEAGGIYYCPNPACTAVGAYWHRSKLKSFSPKDEWSYCVDVAELIQSVDAMDAMDADDKLNEELSIFAEKCIALHWSKQ